MEEEVPMLAIHARAGQLSIRSGLVETASVFDVSGRCMAEWPLAASGWSTFRMQGWPSGTYVVRTASGRTARFIQP